MTAVPLVHPRREQGAVAAALASTWQWLRRHAAWLGWFALYFTLGVYVLSVRGLLPVDALARLASAWLVFQGAEPKLASIGFIWPPLPTLALLPVVLIPGAVKSFLAVALVSAGAMATACVRLGRIAARLGTPKGWRRVIVAAFGLNPMILMFAANGYSEALLILVLLLGLDAVLDFWQRDSDGALLRAALWLSLLPLIRYEAVLLSFAIALAVGAEVVRRARADGDRSAIEGRTLAFAGIAIYPTALWLLFSWQIMGDPLFSANNDRSALSIASSQLGGAHYTLGSGGELAAKLWAGVFPAVVLAVVACAWAGIRRRSPLLVGLGLVPLAIPVSHAILLAGDAIVPLMRYFISAIPLAIVLGLLAIDPARRGRAPRRLHALLGGFVLLLVVSGVSTGLMLSHGKRYQTIERTSWLAMATDRTVSYPQIGDAIDTGRWLDRHLPQHAKVLIDDYGSGFAVVLGSGDSDLFMNHTSPSYRRAIRMPWRYVDYILVEPSGSLTGARNDINVAHPGLYDHGAAWATPVTGMPPTSSRWRLLHVLRSNAATPAQAAARVRGRAPSSSPRAPAGH